MTLFNELPNKLTVCGTDFEIDTDFRTWAQIEKLLLKSQNAPEENLAKVFSLAFCNELPQDPNEALEALFWFYSGGKGECEPKGKSKKTAIYDFEHDADYIYSAFLSEFNIDLTGLKLHWWRFKALLNSVSEECKLSKIMMYRGVDLSKIKDKEQKQFYREMKRMYRLPDERSDEEKEQAIAEAFSAFF